MSIIMKKVIQQFVSTSLHVIFILLKRQAENLNFYKQGK